MPERDDLDQLLDAALSTYAEPRLGIEGRILARVEEARAMSLARRRRWLAWGVALPLTMCIVLYVMVPGGRQPQTNNTQPLARPNQAVAPAVASTQPETRHPATGARARTVKSADGPRSASGATTVAAGPKLDVFPAPRPPGAQERALIALANEPADLHLQALAKASRDDAPLQISAIQIPPISPPDEGKN